MQKNKLSPIVLMKYIVKSAAAALPAKRSILSVTAKLPPYFKSAYSVRLFSYIASSMKKTFNMQTNLGFSRKNHFVFPSDQYLVLFGKPTLYIGERGALELSKSLSQYVDCFIDIGAHVGYFSFYIREHMKESKPIFFFEPDPDLYELINANVNRTSLPNTFGLCKAVGSVDGHLTFYKNPEHPDSGSITTVFAEVHDTIPIQVEATRFDTFVMTHGLKHICVKVDVENAEDEFIRGAERSLDAIDYLIMEVLGRAHKKRFVQRMIHDFKFHAYYINDYTLEYAPEGQFQYISPQYNWLFCREDPDVLKVKLKNSRMRVASR